MRKRKILKGFLIVFVLLAGLALIGLGIGARVYRERAAAYFHEQFSHRSDLVLRPFQTSISVWRHFPLVTFTFRGLSFWDTTGVVPFQVLSVGRAEVAVPLTQFRPDQLKISRVDLDQVRYHQKVDSTGTKTGLRFRKSMDPDTTGDKLPFILPRLRLRNARIISENHFKKSAFMLQISAGDLALTSKNQQLHIRGQLVGKIDQLRSKKLVLFRGQPFTAQVDYAYHFSQKKGVFGNTQALINSNKIRIQGWHQPRAGGPGARLNLTLTGTQPLMYLFRELLPPQAQSFLQRIQTSSRLQVVYRITGESGPRLRPRNQLRFALKNGTFYLPASRKYIRQVNLQGIMDNGPQHAPQTSLFRIDHLSAGVAPEQFQLRLEVANFLEPIFSLQGKGRMDLPAFAAFVKLPLAAVTQGSVSGAFQLQGHLPDTLGYTRSRWRGQGSLQVQGAAFQFLGLAAKCQGINARLRYTDSLLQLQNLSGTVGGYPIKMQASVRNYTAYLFKEPGFIESQASIYAQKLDLNWFRTSTPASPRNRKAAAPASPATQNLPPTWRRMRTEVNLVVDHLRTPGQEQVKNLAVKVRQQGERVTLSRMRFQTTKGGRATAQGGFRLIPDGISRPYLDVRVQYPSLNLQVFLQNLAAFKPTTDAASPKRPGKARKNMEEYMEKRYWLNLHVKAHRLQYLYLQGANLVLTANVNRQRARLTQLHLLALGGQLDAHGQMQLNAPGGNFPLRLRVQVHNINLQHLFRVAESMQLDLLSPRNIQGTAACQLALITQLDKTFSPSFEGTVAYARTNFRNMELIGVAPIQQALRFLRNERTSHLYFQDVHSTFILQDKTFITPGFDLNSNLTDFRLSGTYTMGGPAQLYMDVNVLSVLFGNNKRRIEKIRADSAGAGTQAAPTGGRKQHLLVSREQNKYKVKLRNRKARDESARMLRAEYSRLIRQHSIDTVFLQRP
jgi:hypothetical protein